MGPLRAVVPSCVTQSHNVTCPSPVLLRRFHFPAKRVDMTEPSLTGSIATAHQGPITAPRSVCSPQP